MKPCIPFSCILLLFGVVAFSIFPRQVEATDIFNENFSSTIGDHLNSVVNSEGNVNIVDGSYLHVSSATSHSFPYLYPNNVQFPNSNYSIDLTFRFSGSLNYGSGIIFSDKLLQYGTTSDLSQSDVIFQIWPESASTIDIWSSVCQENDTCSTGYFSKISSFKNDEWHDFKIVSDTNNVYSLSLDGKIIFKSNQSLRKISTFWIGNPQYTSSEVLRPSIDIDSLLVSNLNEETVYPVIIIPGLGASWDVGAILTGSDGGNWQIPSFVTNYDGLVKSFEDAGYVSSGTDQNLFVFPYDWRRSLDTLADRLNDFINTKSPGTKVNLVGHSMGGLVARAYAQKFGTDRINKIVTVGSPNMGTVQAYSPWEGAMVMNDTWWGKAALALTTHFGVIVGESNIQTVQRVVPALKDLLPTYDFLNLNGNVLPWSTLKSKNAYLNNLNQNVASISALTTAIFSSDQQTYSLLKVVAHTDGDLDTWIDGKPTVNPFVLANGDGTVTDFSAKGPFTNTVQGYGWHGELVTRTDDIQKIFGVLEINQASVSAGVYDGDKQVFVAALRSPGELEVCNALITKCNEQLGGYYFPDNKLYILPGYNNENLVVRVTEDGEKGTYKLHLGDIGDVANWEIEEGDLENSGQTDFYTVQSNSQGISATLDVAPKITVDSLTTNDKTPKLTGSIDNRTATIVLKIGTQTFAATNKGDNTWELADNTISPALIDGTYDVIAKATNTIGNVGMDTTSNELTVDSVAPTANFKHFVDGVEFVGPIAYVKKLSQLSFSGNYTDQIPSSGLKQDSFVIFQAQNDHSFAFSNNDKLAYCSWRTGANTISLSGITATLEKIAFTKCVADLPEGEYYMSHQVYDNAIRQDIPSITQFRDVLGLHFMIDKTAPTTTVRGIDTNWHKDPVSINFDCVDTGSGCDKTFYSINGGPMTEGRSLVLSKEGQYTIVYYSVDLAGNSEVAKKTGVIKIDTTPPMAPKIILAFDLGQRIWAGWLPVRDAVKYRIYYGSKKGELTNIIETGYPFWSSNILPQGKYFVSVTALDKAGNESIKSNVVSVNVQRQWWKR
jgi:pimeloyl-ACP methyl ester carboxylesterase